MRDLKFFVAGCLTGYLSAALLVLYVWFVITG
jgi:hypothetical protein